MKRADLTEKILDIKREKGWTWKHICEQIGGMSPVMITGALLGNHKLTKPQAAAAAKLFGLSKTEQAMLNEVPMRGAGTAMPPTDPLIYRFYELVLVNGPAWKELIQEEFGDGIMSAIDFDMVMERLADPKGDRVKIAHVGQVPAVQVLRRDGQRAGVWVQGGVGGLPHRPRAARGVTHMDDFDRIASLAVKNLVAMRCTTCTRTPGSSVR